MSLLPVKRARANNGSAVTRCGESRFFAEVEMCPLQESREPAGSGVRNEKEKVHPTGFEPVTLGSEDRCSVQLSYGCVSGYRNGLGELRQR